MSRSSRPEVRNPLLALPEIAELANIDPAARRALEALLRGIARDAAARAEKAWRSHKGPMAAYWKAVSVYAKHTARAVKSA